MVVTGQPSFSSVRLWTFGPLGGVGIDGLMGPGGSSQATCQMICGAKHNTIAKRDFRAVLPVLLSRLGHRDGKM